MQLPRKKGLKARRLEAGMMMDGGKINLRQAPPEGQATSISYCDDTYEVQIADGNRRKVWELDLRFKTDLSKEGPPGKPVIMVLECRAIARSLPRRERSSSFMKVRCE